ncbi:MAG TPA: hypothetical protein VMJ30_06930 [Gemmatimonadales bacterium]|nr:hypothetical protein [Gemmatimonadales bacterium]
MTPNPTAPSAPQVPWQAPPTPDLYGGNPSALDRDWRPTGQARPKSVMMGLVLTFCFGPLGLFYATRGSGQALPAFLWMGFAVLALIWFPNTGVTPYWLISMIWSTLTIKGYNRRFSEMAGQGGSEAARQ